MTMSLAVRFVWLILALGSSLALGGSQWSITPLDDKAGSDSEKDTGAVISPMGLPESFVAFWIRDNCDAHFGGQIVRSTSGDGGRTWEAPEVVHDGPNEGLYLVAAKTGTMVCAWHSMINGLADIYFSRSIDGGRTWCAARLLQDNSAGADYGVNLATDHRGTWLATWRVHASNISGQDYDVYFSRSTDNGMTWSSKQVLIPAMNEDNPDLTEDVDEPGMLATNGDGMWLACWMTTNKMSGTLGEGTHVMISRSADNGATWGPAQPIGKRGLLVGECVGNRVQLVTDGKGGWIAASHANSGCADNGTDYDIMIARSTDNGKNWTDFTTVYDLARKDTGKDVYPFLRFIEDQWLLVWGSEDKLGGLKGESLDVVYATSSDRGETWSGPSLIDKPDDTARDYPCDVAMGTEGKWVLTFQGEGRLGRDYDVFFARNSVPDITGPGTGIKATTLPPVAPQPAPPILVGPPSTPRVVMPGVQGSEEVVIETEGPATFTIKDGTVQVETKGKASMKSRGASIRSATRPATE